MAKKFKKGIDNTTIILIIIVLILIIVNLTLYIKKIITPKQVQQDTSQLSTVISEKNNETKNIEIPQTDDELKKYLSTLGERDRMEYYCGKYFKHIEKKEYEAAYNMLYTEFKQNYFPTIEEYEEYIDKTYPKYWALEYDDITRQGNIYVLRLKILDVLGSKENEKIQRVVIKENNYNDFVLSFQVI